MVVNIKEKYDANIHNKYSSLEDPKFVNAYNLTEQGMWSFTLSLLRTNPKKDLYDNIKDERELTQRLEVFKLAEDVDFSIDAWFDFMTRQ